MIQLVSKDKKDRRKKSRFGNEEQLKKKSLFPNAVPRIFFNPSRHIRKLESEILSEATIDYPEQGYLLKCTDNYPFGCGSICVKVEKILKGSLDSVPSPTPSVKIQIMGRKVCLRCKCKILLGIVNKLLKSKILLTSPSNILPYYLK